MPTSVHGSGRSPARTWHDEGVQHHKEVKPYDLVVIGSGSANSIIDQEFEHRRVALIERGTFGGTCLNVGCIPTKMYVHPADLARMSTESSRLGVDLELRAVHWPAIRDRIFGRIDKISAAGEQYRATSDDVDLYRSAARFVGPRTLRLESGETITGDQVVIAAGSRVTLPDLPGLSEVDHYTSDTVMRLDRLPRSMIIIGGGYVAAEFAHVFSSFGTRVTMLNRTDRLLRGEDHEVAERFTEQISRYVDVELRHVPQRVQAGPNGSVTVHSLDADGRPCQVSAEVLLVATGRRSNADTLDLDRGGIDVDDAGLIVVDDEQRTTAENVFALGDVSSPYQLKHVANAEARVVRHNLLHPDALIASDHRFVPHAVFSDPQIASVGITEDEARERQVRHVTATRAYGDVAYGWAMEDDAHFVKLLADPDTGLLLGAHLVGPEAANLIQPLIQAMSFGLPAPEMARGQYWIHPALAEVVENALLALPLNS